MKKILCVMVAVVLCFGAVLVTASAETPMKSYNGVLLPYYPFHDYEGNDLKYFAIFEENDGSYTLFVSTSPPMVNVGTDGNSVGLFLINSECLMYTYSGKYDSWANFGTHTHTNLGFYKFGSFDNLLWVSHDLKDNNANLYMSGDPNPCFMPKPLYDVVDKVFLDSFDEKMAYPLGSTLFTLLPIGIGIMALFVGISLIPRVIYKFL